MPIHLDPQTQAELVRAADSCGVDPDSFVRDVLIGEARRVSTPHEHGLDGIQFVEALQKHAGSAPALPESACRRESLYEDVN